MVVIVVCKVQVVKHPNVDASKAQENFRQAFSSMPKAPRLPGFVMLDEYAWCLAVSTLKRLVSFIENSRPSPH